MSLRSIDFSDTYWSGENDLIQEFYIPCMEQSIAYDRAVGYFNSTILCYISNGLYPFIKNGGRIRIVCSVNLSKEDKQNLRLGYDIREIIGKKVEETVSELVGISIANVKNLCWLVKNNRLDIKICMRKVPDERQNLFHENLVFFEMLMKMPFLF